MAQYYLSFKETVTIHAGSSHFHVRPRSRDIEVATEVFFNEYQALQLAHNQIKFKTKPIVVDAGAYIGFSVVEIARLLPNATIVAIEPHAGNFSLLRKNTKHLDNVLLLNAALAGSAERQTTLKNRGTGHWGYTIVETPADTSLAPEEHAVQTVSLESVTSMIDGASIDFLKLDIEGGELDVLKSSARLISSIPFIFIETHDRIQPGCTATLFSACKDHWIIKASGEKYVLLR